MLEQYLILCLCAALGGAVNAVAGGGTLLTFPALIAVLTLTHGGNSDVAKVLANGTSTVALFPASLTALWSFRREFAVYGHWWKRLVPSSLIGGTLGAVLVTQMPERYFAALVPWLILLAASLFAFQPIIARKLGVGKPHEAPHGRTVIGIMIFQFIVGVYGGYFGAGIGILMLSALAMMGLSDIHAMNGLKNLLGSCINGSAVVIWIVTDKVEWSLALPMLVAGCLGSFTAAYYARKLPRPLVRWFVICIGFALAAKYFLWP